MSPPQPDLPPALWAELDLHGQEFLARFLSIETCRHPENLGALHDLGHALTHLRRHDEALAVDLELARRQPDDPTAHYNLACSLALLARAEEALDALEHAIELGYDDAPHLRDDDDLASLRPLARFAGLLARLERDAGAAPDG